MKVNKKVTDFIKLEDGNIGRKAAVVTGALLASTVLGSVLSVQVAEAHCNGHQNYWMPIPGGGIEHHDTHVDLPNCE